MATATSVKTPDKMDKTGITLPRKIAYGAIAVVAVLSLWLLINFASIKAEARLGASYGAHIACSCRYIAGRPLETCIKDFEPGMGIISITDDPANKRIAASVPLMAHAVAERRGKFGCIQLNDKEIGALD
jgi:hypothetical protein